MPTLCQPHPDTLCFGCCPPIRPPHYDPLDFIPTLRREFADNRQRFRLLGPHQGAIVGFSCWALGFVDATGRLAGCLLHPAQHLGRDLRDVTGYGDKCRRERCLAAQVFAALSPEAQAFWLESATGLPCFYYSSRRANPLFHILLWGTPILEHLCRDASQFGWTATELLWRQPFLADRRWLPRAHRYPVRLILASASGAILQTNRAIADTCRLLLSEIDALPGARPDREDPPQALYLHQLPLADDYLDFLRIALGWRRTTWRRAVAFQEEIECLAAQNHP
ncbi:MAG TPA: hypothetical protein DCZ69_14025 [Syntrophobacteraceae bacterium]|nr:hypothetical protein [Syntrophobacteraceae bacterium]